MTAIHQCQSSAHQVNPHSIFSILSLFAIVAQHHSAANPSIGFGTRLPDSHLEKVAKLNNLSNEWIIEIAS